jgi:hypothetical protein
MRAVVGSAVKLDVEEDEEALPSCRLVMFVALAALVPLPSVYLASFSPTFP